VTFFYSFRIFLSTCKRAHAHVFVCLGGSEVVQNTQILSCINTSEIWCASTHLFIVVLLFSFNGLFPPSLLNRHLG